MPDSGRKMDRTIETVTERLDSEVPRLLAEHDVPGIAIGICHRSGAAWSAGFGVTSRGGADPVSTRTMFSLQSTSKMYTATAVMLAIQDGRLNLDEPITTYLPEFTVRSRWESAPEQRMTLRRLLAHRVGLTHEAPLGGNLDDRDTSFEEHCASIRDTWLRSRVGHHFEYSNLGIDIAAYAVQRVTGVDFHEYVRRELLEPLELRRTTFDHELIARDTDRAIGHSKTLAEPPVRVPMVGAGGAYASVDDALGFVRFHLAGGLSVLRTDLLDQLYRVPDPLPGQRFGYGLGVAVSRWNGRRVLEHGGGGFGFLCDLGWDPRSGFGIVVLTNSEDHPLQARLAPSILRDLCGEDSASTELPPAADLDRDTRTSMAGEYVGRGASTARIDFDGSRLSLRRWGNTDQLRALGPNEVVAEDDSRSRFRLLDHIGAPGRSYLVNVDNGMTYYRNDPPSGVEVSECQSYVVDYKGARVAELRVRQHADGSSIEGDGFFERPPLQLEEHEPGLYFCAMGEALDLTTDPPTYANVRLQPKPE